jgi:hypothetical protein
MANRIGDFFVTSGKMTPDQVEQVLRAQKQGDTRRFGEIALALGFVGDDSLRRFMDYLERNPAGPA